MEGVRSRVTGGVMSPVYPCLFRSCPLYLASEPNRERHGDPGAGARHPGSRIPVDESNLERGLDPLQVDHRSVSERGSSGPGRSPMRQTTGHREQKLGVTEGHRA